jgi:hypothetical protein
VKVQINRDKLGLAEISCDWEGPNSVSSENGEPINDPEYSFVPDVAEKNIDTHPNFWTTADGFSDYILSAASLSGGTFSTTVFNEHLDATKRIFVKFGKNTSNDLHGVESYLAWQSGRYSKRYLASSEPTSYIANLGKTYSTAQLPGPSSGKPTLPGSGNWLLIGVDYTKRGSVFDVILTWKASDSRGWNPYIYLPATV